MWAGIGPNKGSVNSTQNKYTRLPRDAGHDMIRWVRVSDQTVWGCPGSTGHYSMYPAKPGRTQAALQAKDCAANLEGAAAVHAPVESFHFHASHQAIKAQQSWRPEPLTSGYHV